MMTAIGKYVENVRQLQLVVGSEYESYAWRGSLVVSM